MSTVVIVLHLDGTHLQDLEKVCALKRVRADFMIIYKLQCNYLFHFHWLQRVVTIHSLYPAYLVYDYRYDRARWPPPRLTSGAKYSIVPQCTPVPSSSIELLNPACQTRLFIITSHTEHTQCSNPFGTWTRTTLNPHVHVWKPLINTPWPRLGFPQSASLTSSLKYSWGGHVFDHPLGSQLNHQCMKSKTRSASNS